MDASPDPAAVMVGVIRATEKVTKNKNGGEQSEERDRDSR